MSNYQVRVVDHQKAAPFFVPGRYLYLKACCCRRTCKITVQVYSTGTGTVGLPGTGTADHNDHNVQYVYRYKYRENRASKNQSSRERRQAAGHSVIKQLKVEPVQVLGLPSASAFFVAHNIDHTVILQ